nr:Chain L, FITC-RJPXD33 [Phage display vector pdvec0]
TNLYMLPKWDIP